MSVFPKSKQAMPVLMGAAMGLIMLWMLHGVLVSESALGGWALTLFVGAHLGVALLLLAGTLFAARLSPRLQGWLARLHRPSPRHLAIMIASAATAAGVAHLVIHGGLT